MDVNKLEQSEIGDLSYPLVLKLRSGKFHKNLHLASIPSPQELPGSAVLLA